MSKSIRFHLDEHIDPSIARGLRRYGIDVTTTEEKLNIFKLVSIIVILGSGLLLAYTSGYSSFRCYEVH